MYSRRKIEQWRDLLSTIFTLGICWYFWDPPLSPSNDAKEVAPEIPPTTTHRSKVPITPESLFDDAKGVGPEIAPIAPESLFDDAKGVGPEIAPTTIHRSNVCINFEVLFIYLRVAYVIGMIGFCVRVLRRLQNRARQDPDTC